MIQKFLTGWPKDIKVAATFLLRVPVPVPHDMWEKGLTTAIRAFPIVGAFVGLISGLIMYLLLNANFPPLLCALGAITSQILITGALHEDGLADFTDGLGGGKDRQQCLAIMRDPRIGTFGVLALIFSVGFRVSALASIPASEILLALIAAGLCSRSFVPIPMIFLMPAHENGLGASAGKPEISAATTAILIGVVPLFFFFTFHQACLIIILCFAILVALMFIAQKKLGGFTGDVLGTMQQLTEAAVLVLIAGW
ncbi:MAG: Adenosylcobinamide-GDP ribazoletransferase [Alphaproteobacteria bacterium MarineAlpha3_Bin5]|nr:adenosylcobinamide-GDP ribazoletransferase [Magnetovibrio sp.]PPR77938.1 MAG: Adenosylcobinamide-GDP ribazoletransferase [Alphaproteobacteria bacterium MarineAlpha3_Bin5]